MAEFTYQATIDDKLTTGSVMAATKSEAMEQLRAQRIQVVNLKENKITLPQISGGVGTVEKANLCRYLSTMISAGLPLAEAVDTITKDTKTKTLKTILLQVQQGLQQGETLSDLLAKYPKIFDSVFIAIVKSGEQSGTLNRSFQYLETQLMANHALSQKVKGALMYPAVIVGTMFGVGTILVVFVVPQIAQVFLKTKLPIPKLTVFVLQAGLTLNKNLGLIAAILASLIVGLIVVIRTQTGRKAVLRILKRLPIVTRLFEKLDLARFSRTLATLMESGVPITQSIGVATSTLSHAKFASFAKALEEDIKTGESIASIMRTHSDVVPQMMISMVATGEKTGTTDKILFNVAEFYEEELENEIKNFTAILEPVIMLVIGIGVGGMVLSVIAPIYSLVSSLQATK